MRELYQNTKISSTAHVDVFRTIAPSVGQKGFVFSLLLTFFCARGPLMVFSLSRYHQSARQRRLHGSLSSSWRQYFLNSPSSHFTQFYGFIGILLSFIGRHKWREHRVQWQKGEKTPVLRDMLPFLLCTNHQKALSELELSVLDCAQLLYEEWANYSVFFKYQPVGLVRWEQKSPHTLTPTRSVHVGWKSDPGHLIFLSHSGSILVKRSVCTLPGWVCIHRCWSRPPLWASSYFCTDVQLLTTTYPGV